MRFFREYCFLFAVVNFFLLCVGISQGTSEFGTHITDSEVFNYCNTSLCNQTIKSSASFSTDEAKYNSCTSLQHACVVTDSSDNVSDFYLLKSICHNYCFGSKSSISYKDSDFNVFLTCQSRCLQLTKKKQLPLTTNVTMSYRFYGDYLSCFEDKCAPILLKYELDSQFNQYRIIYSSCWESQLLCVRARASYNVTLINQNCYKTCSASITNTYSPFSSYLSCDSTCLSDTISAESSYKDGLYLEANGVSEYEIALLPDNTELTTGFWVSLSIGLFFIFFVTIGLLTLIRIYNKTTYFKYESNFTESDDEEDDDEDDEDDDDDDNEDDDDGNGDDDDEDDEDNNHNHNDEDDRDGDRGDEDGSDRDDYDENYNGQRGNRYAGATERGKKTGRDHNDGRNGDNSDYDPTGKNSSVYHRSNKKYSKQLSSLEIFMKKAEQQHQMKQQQSQKQSSYQQQHQLQILEQSSEFEQKNQSQQQQQESQINNQSILPLEESHSKSDIEEQRPKIPLKKKVSRLSKQRLEAKFKGKHPSQSHLQVPESTQSHQPQSQQHELLTSSMQNYELNQSGGISGLEIKVEGRRQIDMLVNFSLRSNKRSTNEGELQRSAHPPANQGETQPMQQHLESHQQLQQQHHSSKQPHFDSNTSQSTTVPTTAIQIPAIAKKALGETRKSVFSQTSTSSSGGHTATTASARGLLHHGSTIGSNQFSTSQMQFSAGSPHIHETPISNKLNSSQKIIKSEITPHTTNPNKNRNNSQQTNNSPMQAAQEDLIEDSNNLANRQIDGPLYFSQVHNESQQIAIKNKEQLKQFHEQAQLQYEINMQDIFDFNFSPSNQSNSNFNNSNSQTNQQSGLHNTQDKLSQQQQQSSNIPN